MDQPRAKRPELCDAFIAYSHRGDAESKGRIVSEVHRQIDQGIRAKFDWPPYVFLDKIHIPARNSPDWEAYAARAIDAALIYVAVIDTHFFRSDGCMRELNYLIKTERAGRPKPVEVFAIYVDESYPQPGTAVAQRLNNTGWLLRRGNTHELHWENHPLGRERDWRKLTHTFGEILDYYVLDDGTDFDMSRRYKFSD
jgi:TIR domain